MRSLLLALSCIVVSGIAALGLWWALVSIQRDELPTAIVMLAFALAFLGISAPLVPIMFGRVTARTTVAEGATTIRPDRVVAGLATSSAVCMFVTVATFAIWYPQGRLALPMRPHDAYIAMFAVALTLLGGWNLWSICTHGGSSFIRLSPEGFALRQGTSTIRGDWADVTAITDRRPGRRAPLRATLWLQLASGGQRAHVVDSYTARPEAIRRLVRYYADNPERRDELADGRAVERFATLAAEA